MASSSLNIFLNPKHEKKISRGYPWIFANQISRTEGTAKRGDISMIYGSDGQWIGQGFYHDTSQIAVRLLSYENSTPFDDDFFRRRLQRAAETRDAYYVNSTHYRLLFSESDGFPGTIVDRYGDVFTWTSLCYGMEQRREMILDLIEEHFAPIAIIERNDGWLREKDDLPRQKSVLRGTYTGDLVIEENGVRFAVDVMNGPKTGFFIDQREHRHIVSRLAKDRRVLDVCCADGGFGLQAAQHGAASVHFIDSAGHALERAQANAGRNNIACPLFFDEAEALKRLGQLVDEGQTFDLIVLDPPAFAKSKRHIDTATKAYQRLNINAMKLLSENGILATSSCSQAVSEAEFLKIVRYSARKTGTRMNMMYRGFQPPDHPVMDSMPETHYLKFFLFQKSWA